MQTIVAKVAYALHFASPNPKGLNIRVIYRAFGCSSVALNAAVWYEGSNFKVLKTSEN